MIEPREHSRKLEIIARQSRDELAGYEAQAKSRGFFPGEYAAILQRKTELEGKQPLKRRYAK